jgi:hypothetical protein
MLILYKNLSHFFSIFSSGQRIEYRGNVLKFGDVAGDHKGTIRRCTFNGLQRLVKVDIVIEI